MKKILVYSILHILVSGCYNNTADVRESKQNRGGFGTSGGQRASDAGSFTIGDFPWGHAFKSGNVSDIPRENGGGEIDLQLKFNITGSDDNNTYTLEYPHRSDAKYVSPGVLSSLYSAYLLCGGVVQEGVSQGIPNFVIGKFYDNIPPAEIALRNNEMSINFKLSSNALRLGINCRLEISANADPTRVVYEQVLELNNIVYGAGQSFNPGDDGKYRLRTIASGRKLAVMNDPVVISLPSPGIEPVDEAEAAPNELISDNDYTELTAIYDELFKLNEIYVKGCDSGDKWQCPENTGYLLVGLTQEKASNTSTKDVIYCYKDGEERSGCFSGDGDSQTPNKSVLLNNKPAGVETRRPLTGMDIENFPAEWTINQVAEVQEVEAEYVSINNKVYLVNRCIPDILAAADSGSAQIPIMCEYSVEGTKNLMQPYKTVSDGAQRAIRWSVARKGLIAIAAVAAVVFIPPAGMAVMGYGGAGIAYLSLVNTLAVSFSIVSAPFMVGVIGKSLDDLDKCGNDFRCKVQARASMIGAAIDIVFAPVDLVLASAFLRTSGKLDNVLKAGVGKIADLEKNGVKLPKGSRTLLFGVTSDWAKALFRPGDYGISREFAAHAISKLRLAIDESEDIAEITRKADEFFANINKIDEESIGRFLDTLSGLPGCGLGLTGGFGLTCTSSGLRPLADSVNDHRAANGRPPLRKSNFVTEYAKDVMAKIQDKAESGGDIKLLNHAVADEARADYVVKAMADDRPPDLFGPKPYSSENIQVAENFYISNKSADDPPTPDVIFGKWQDSPSHNTTMLLNFKSKAIGGDTFVFGGYSFRMQHFAGPITVNGAEMENGAWIVIGAFIGVMP